MTDSAAHAAGHLHSRMGASETVAKLWDWLHPDERADWLVLGRQGRYLADLPWEALPAHARMGLTASLALMVGWFANVGERMKRAKVRRSEVSV